MSYNVPMFAIRAPDHLGDGVMALPAIAAIAALGPTRVYAPRWGAELYYGLEVHPKDDRPSADVGVLLKPSFGAAWRWRHLPRRVGIATMGRSVLLTDPLAVRDEHRRDGYARVAMELGAGWPGLPTYRARGTSPALVHGSVALNPWSPTVTVRWPRFRALADMLVERGVPVVFFCGPGEADAVAAIAGPHPLLAGLSLPDFAAALDQCRAFVSNDSGAAHFAAACGVPVTMIHGSTVARRTGVGQPVDGPPLACRPCYRKSCFRALECLTEVSAERVLGVLLEPAG